MHCMNCRLLALLLLGLLPAFTGCALCASPWDYCGPVFAGGNCTECVTDARVGSAFYAPGVNPGDVVIEAVPITGGPEGPAETVPPPEASESPSDTRPEFNPPIPDRQTFDFDNLRLRR